VAAPSDAIPAFYCALLDWSAGARGQTIVDAAASALAEGLDTPALRYLAGATRAAADTEAGELFLISDSGHIVPKWRSAQESLAGRAAVPAALANSRLLATMPEGWRDRVVARTSMHDLLFTRPDDRRPFSYTVRVSWADDVYTFTLTNEVGVGADKCRESNAPDVLAAFLCQLVGGEPQ
jgi:hypothetical protein